MKRTIHLIAALAFALLRTASAQSPIEAEMLPPDFLISQREALGLEESQVQAIQAVIQEVGPQFEKHKQVLEERTRAVQEALHQPKQDIDQTMEKVRALVTQENEMKLLQMRTMLTLRSKLTPEQLEKARPMRMHQMQQMMAARAAGGPGGGNPGGEAHQRLQHKFEQLHKIIQERAAGGQPPEEIVKRAQEVHQLVQAGKLEEAERMLSEILEQLRKDQ
jgi:hypothetical protein